MQDKKCTKCSKFKPLGAFNKRKKSHDGLNSSCKECIKAYNRQPLQKLRGIYNKQVGSSKRRGHNPPAYSRDEFVDKYINDKLYINLHKAWVDSNYDTALAPSLDRINKKKK